MERRISIFFPLVLISAGLLWIMIQMHIIQSSNLWALVYLWPFLLISAGLGLILRSYWKYVNLVMDVLVIGGAFLAVFFAPKLGWTHAPDYLWNGNGFIISSGERGSGKIITQSRDVKDFKSIQLGYPAQVTITQGETESLTIVADDNVAAEISSKVVNGDLEITNVHGSRLPISPTQPVKISIVTKNLAELEFDTAGEVKLDGLKTDQLKLMMNGAGALTLKNIELNVLDCNLSGVGSVEASGTADTIKVHVEGLGNFNGGDLQSQTATVNLDGMGGATVWADKSLNANVSGMGSVSYYGDATLTKSVDGLGDIKYLGKK